MKSHWLFLTWIIFSLTACDRSWIDVGPKGPGLRPGGDEVGNGGEALQVLFEMGHRHAQMVLKNVIQDSINESDSMTANTDLKLFRDHQADLLIELGSSEVVWTKEPVPTCPSDRCSCTSSKKGGTIYLNFRNCDHRYSLPSQAGKVLIHEAGHHLFGEAEEKPNSVAATAYTLWKDMGHSDEPHWMTISKKGIPRFNRFSQAAWTGTELIAWDPQGTIGYYNPRQKMWREEKTASGYDHWYREKRSAETSPGYWINGKLHVYSPCHGSRRSEGAGQSYDPDTKSWSLIPHPGAPSNREASAKLYKDNLVVWGGESCGEQPHPRTDGAIWNVTTGLWTPIALPLGMPSEFGYSWIIAKDTLFVWGGTTNTKAWLYDLKLKTWASWSFSNDDKSTTTPLLINTGKEVLAIAMGGAASFRLNVETRKAVPIKPMPADSSYPEHIRGQGLRNGAFVQGRGLYFYDLIGDSWKSSNDSLRPQFHFTQSWHWNDGELIVWAGGNNNDDVVGFLFYP